MEHPNAIYFDIASAAALLLIGLLFAIAFFEKGPYKNVVAVPKWAFSGLGLLLVFFGGFKLYVELAQLLSR